MLNPSFNRRAFVLTTYAHVLLLGLGMSSANATDEVFVGDWRSLTHENGALPGLLSFKKDGSAVLHPVGFDPQKGSWERVKKKSNTLLVTLNGIGSSEIQFSIKRGRLVLVYNNGNTQEFERLPR